MSGTRIGISLRIVNSNTYPETRDALSHDWAPFLEEIGLIPILIPNNLSNLDQFLEQTKIDGLILSGGDNIGDFPVRDNTEKKVLDYGIKNKIPTIGICRGMQLINDYFGGSIKTAPNSSHLRNKHFVKILDTQLSRALETEEIEVNSFHNNIITKDLLGENLVPTSIVNDNTIESIKHTIYDVFAVMWHPEREKNLLNKKLILELLKKK